MLLRCKLEDDARRIKLKRQDLLSPALATWRSKRESRGCGEQGKCHFEKLIFRLHVNHKASQVLSYLYIYEPILNGKINMCSYFLKSKSHCYENLKLASK